MDFRMSGAPFPGVSQNPQSGPFPMGSYSQPNRPTYQQPPYGYAGPPMFAHPMSAVPVQQSSFDGSDFPDFRGQVASGIMNMGLPPGPSFSIADEAEFPALGPFHTHHGSSLGQPMQTVSASVPSRGASGLSSGPSSVPSSPSPQIISPMSPPPGPSLAVGVGAPPTTGLGAAVGSGLGVGLAMGMAMGVGAGAGVGVGVSPAGSVLGNASSGSISSGGGNSATSSNLTTQPKSELETYGLLGLLEILSMSKPDLSMISLGLDLTQLGLNLGSQEPLFKSFLSPWIETSPSQKNFKVPACYRMSPPALRPQNFQKFALETLFFIFYAMPRDLLQAAAAQELYNRKWRYHKQLKQWISRAPRTDPTVKSSTFERGSYIVFDPHRWEKSRKENFLLMYDQLEELKFAKPQQGTGPQQHQVLQQSLQGPGLLGLQHP
eukprot:ANDGO_03761.mRNA.1 putative NOT transcription complex subunit VIP2